MKKRMLAIALGFALQSPAQFYYFPFPPSATDYSITEKAGVKICYEYQLADDSKTLVSVLEFGAKGLPAAGYLKGIDDNGDSATTEESIYKYNNQLKLAAITRTNHEENDRSVTAFTYDAKGRLIKKVIATIDPPTYTYHYDAAGRIIKMTCTTAMPELDKEGDPTGKSFNAPTSISVFKYDAKGRLQEEWYYHTDKTKTDGLTPHRKYRWEYNLKHQVIKISVTDSDNEITDIQEFSYNDKGLLIKKTVRSVAEGETETYVYEYCTDCKQSWMQ